MALSDNDLEGTLKGVVEYACLLSSSSTSPPLANPLRVSFQLDLLLMRFRLGFLSLTILSGL